MKNLFNRLKPEFLERLEIEQKIFESTINQLFIDLKKNKYWFDLSYSTICTLKVHLYLSDYSPSSIDNLFEE